MKIKVVDIHIFFLILYIITKPLYIFENSPVQIADLIIIFNIIFVLITYYKVVILYPEKIFSLIVIYQFLVNICAYFMWKEQTLESFSLLKNNLYYIFNLCLMIYISTLIKFGNIKVIKGITRGLTFSMIIILIGLILNTGTSRNSSFFNNPNQLGYYAILVIASTALLHKFYTEVQKNICIIIAFLSILMCTSKAAIIAIMIFYVVRYGIKKRYKIKSVKINKKKIFIILILLIFMIILILKFQEVLLHYVNVLLQRLETIRGGNTNLGSGRGYNRIKEIDFKILCGVGEGAFYRFNTMPGNETHSSYMTIIISYGIIGFGFYLAFFKEIIQKKYFKFFSIFSGVFIYWISHNGLRNSLVWILFILMYEMEVNKRKRRQL